MGYLHFKNCIKFPNQDYTMIKRVEFIETLSIIGLINTKPSKIVSYYLLGFILIYRSVVQRKPLGTTFLKEE